MDKFTQLLDLLKQSPLFGAYHDLSDFQHKPEIIQEVKKFLELEAQQFGVDVENKDFNPIVLKTFIYTGLIVSGYAELGKLLPLMKITSLAYLLDELVDNSDKPDHYLNVITGLAGGTPLPLTKLVNQQLTQFPQEYSELIREMAFQDISRPQFLLREMALKYFLNTDNKIISENSGLIIRYKITSIGLRMVVFSIYIVLLQEGIVRTPLAEMIDKHERLIRILEGFLRLADDLGDLEADEGLNINIFNLSEATFLQSFLSFCGISHKLAENTTRLEIFRIFYNSSKLEIAKIDNTSRDTQIFLSLLLRFMEGGFINIVGDAFFESANYELSPEVLLILKDFNYQL